MSKITIKDIARLAGVSIATVSYIVNGVHEEKYTRETKQKVLQIINLYDYHPSKLARAFVTSKSNNIILLTDKHETVLQKSESFDLVRMLGKALEAIGYNLVIRSHLEAIRIDSADAIICAGMEEEKFLQLAKENFVPLLTVDARIHDDLFFQVFQDFEAVMKAGGERFGEGNFTVVLVDMYNEAHRKEIREICGEKVVFLKENAVTGVPGGNIVTVNASLPELEELRDREFLFVPALTEKRINAVIDCFRKASEHTTVDTHVILV